MMVGMCLETGAKVQGARFPLVGGLQGHAVHLDRLAPVLSSGVLIPERNRHAHAHRGVRHLCQSERERATLSTSASLASEASIFRPAH